MQHTEKDNPALPDCFNLERGANPLCFIVIFFLMPPFLSAPTAHSQSLPVFCPFAALSPQHMPHPAGAELVICAEPAGLPCPPACAKLSSGLALINKL